jgi:hypothetical protein
MGEETTMLKHRNRLIAAAGAVVTAGAIATAGVMTAAAASHPARVSGTENFQMMTTSATSSSDALIASGVFTVPGVDHENRQNNTSILVFANGTVSLKHSPGKGTQSVNPKTCLLTVNFHGTYTLTGGTGAYAGITGSGTYKLSILAIAARSGGKCSSTAPPAAWQQVIRATGPVNL